jgi:TolB-like protein/Flp pilus assembly protein TadD
MGIHSGPVSGVIDVTGKANVAGAGINMAQRVMDCGDAGHILLSKHVAEDLEQYPHWQPYLHELGECEVKHGVRVSVVNLYTNELGNPAVPEKLKIARLAAAVKRRRAAFRRLSLAVLALLVAAAAIGFLFFQYPQRFAGTTSAVPQKSIAVLPFENLSENKENAFFADGVQDEILTDLAKVADLKVISRTSVIGYREIAGRNLRKIGQELGVAHLLEGSVQRAGNRVRVNAQLVDARTDAHLWAQTYDRDLADVFAIQSEIAKTIADQLQAKLTGQEQQAIAAKPTDNPEAYDSYLRGRALETSADSSTLARTADFFAEAARLDPTFTLAWARLSITHSQIYYILDHLPSRRDAAKLALDKARGLNGNLDEVLLAAGYYNYWVRRDFESAATAFRQVLSRLPNNAEALFALSLIERRQGKWSECLTHQNLAAQLDPQNAYRLGQLVGTYFALKDFAAAHSIEERVLKIRDDAEPRAGLARLYLAQGDVERAEAAIRGIAPTPDNSYVFEIQVRLALITHRYADAISMLEEAVTLASPSSGFRLGEYQYLLAFSEQLAGNPVAARENYERAKVELEKSRRTEPENPDAAMYLSFVYAGFGDKAGAIREADDAITLLPSSADALQGPAYEEARARIQASVGEADSAIAEVRRLLDVNYTGPEQIALTPAMLRLDPAWDPLRNDQRFQQLAASPAPKEKQ